MSRTDQHAPLRVRIARNELAAWPEHDHRTATCDLAERRTIASVRDITTRCSWRFAFSGVYICSCPLCHAGPQRRADRHAARRRDHIRLDNALRLWCAGDTKSFDDFAPVDGRHFR